MPAPVLHRTLVGPGLWMMHRPLAEHNRGAMMFSFNVA
jgi:hypothetical protein